MVLYNSPLFNKRGAEEEEEEAGLAGVGGMKVP
jgi:hypothetical protein